MAAPTVTSVAPIHGSAAGGTAVTITGTVFAAPASVTFGGNAATSVIVVSATSITAVTPSHLTTGLVNVSVTTPGGTGSGAGLYTYDPSDFPLFTPIVPPPLFGLGGGPPPAFPPPTPPPIGVIPPGFLASQAVAAAAVPPSTAGFPLLKYGSGSATVPVMAGYFPIPTAPAYPVPPVQFSAVQPPPKLATTPPIGMQISLAIADGGGGGSGMASIPAFMHSENANHHPKRGPGRPRKHF